MVEEELWRESCVELSGLSVEESQYDMIHIVGNMMRLAFSMEKD